MAFMTAEIVADIWYLVETESGESFLVPQDACGELPILDGEMIGEHNAPPDVWETITGAALDYTDGSTIREVTAQAGYCGRLIAAGYMDSTDWNGPHETEQESRAALADTYDLCPCCLEETDENGACLDENCPPGLDEFVNAYTECALFASSLEPFGDCPNCGKADVPLPRWRDRDSRPTEYVCADCGVEAHYLPPADDNYSTDDLAPETVATFRADCRAFLARFRHLIPEGRTESAGHDYWLTRNHHGAGFWDRGHGFYPDGASEVLTDASHADGETYLYVGADGRIYQQ